MNFITEVVVTDRFHCSVIFYPSEYKNAFLMENTCVSSNISLKFVLKCQINNIPALVQIMAWRRIFVRFSWVSKWQGIHCVQHYSQGHIKNTLSAFWQNFCRCLDWKLSFWQLLVQQRRNVCHFENFRRSQWRKCHPNDDVSVSVWVDVLGLHAHLPRNSPWC